LGYVKERDLTRKQDQGLTKADLYRKTALLLSSWFGSGLMPIAPGTFGTLAAVPPAIIIYYFGTVPSVISLIVIIPLAVWTSNVTQKLLGKDDPSEIVIDEVAGFFVTVFLLPFSWLSFTLGFLLFRVFDILKPFPIGIIDKKIKGGTGIVLDDIVAGIYANICVRVVQAIFGL
jgi:phosphatidylglycerophosphatase A